MPRWCKQCGKYGHRKWLFLGSHWTHRLYIQFKIRQEIMKHRK